MSDDDKKVVQFPMHKVKRPSAVTSNQPLPAPVNPQKKVALLVSLILTVLVATLTTNHLSHNKDLEFSDRVPANAMAERRDLDQDLLLAKKIAHESLREPASRGHEPTPEDILRHGDLADLYSLNFEHGGLTGITFTESSGSEPRYLMQREKFMMNHMDLFRLNFDQVKKIEAFQDENFRFEVYRLEEHGQEKAMVHFKLNNKDQLYSMKVELPKSE